MTFEQWTAANGFGQDLTDHQRQTLRALYDRHQAQGLPAAGIEAGRPKHDVVSPRHGVDVHRLGRVVHGLMGRLDRWRHRKDPGTPVPTRGGKIVIQAAAGPQLVPSCLELPATGPVEFENLIAAEDDDGDPKPPTFKMLAYTGKAMLLGWLYPVVIDLTGLKISRRPRPVLWEHNREGIVGHTTDVDASGNRLRVAGVVSGTGQAAHEVVDNAKQGFPWRASVNARADQMLLVEEGKTVQVNGRTFKGPIYVARKSTLGEISFVALAADDDTGATVAAGADGEHRKVEVMTMNFEEWLTAKGFDSAALSDGQRTFLKAAYDAEIAAAGDGTKPAGDQGGAPAPGKDAAAGDQQVETPTPATVKAAADLAVDAERKRVGTIEAACKGFEGERPEELRAQAMAGTITLDDLRAALLEHVRTERASVEPTAQEADSGRKVLLAAAYQAGSLPQESTLAICGEPALEAAGQIRGIGLQEFCARVCQLEGVELPRFQTDSAGWLRAAFSTVGLTGILSNIANKFLLAGFMAVEDAWRQIAATRSVKDFKTVTSYRMTGDAEFDEVGPTGELKHATVGEESFTNQAKTYGKMFSNTRTDIINDDLGALTAMPRRIGRGAGLKLNTVFWTRFLNNAAFFTAALNNYQEGAATALGVDSLTAAELLFLTQVDPDSKPLGILPKVLLVPPAKLVTATMLMKSAELRELGTSAKKYMTANPHASKFSVVPSAYLSNATLSGYSALAWYLLADPNDVATIEVAFLNGVQEPTVQRADADFNVLGIQYRGFFDFGVNLQESRAGVKSKGEA